MNYLLSLFAKPHRVTMIRDGKMYRLTYKRERLVKEELLDVFGGFTGLNEHRESGPCTDRSRTDLNRVIEPEKQINFTKNPETL